VFTRLKRVLHRVGKAEQKSKLSRMEISWIMMDFGLDKASTQAFSFQGLATEP
jgi:hypothetical protein